MNTVKNGIPLVCEAVTSAAHLLSQLKRNGALDDRERQACEIAQKSLEEAEKVLYGK